MKKHHEFFKREGSIEIFKRENRSGFYNAENFSFIVEIELWRADFSALTLISHFCFLYLSLFA